MTQKFLKFFSLSTLVLSTCFVSCDKEDNDKQELVIDPVSRRAFILNEGSWNANNSTLDRYNPYSEPTVLDKLPQNQTDPSSAIPSQSAMQRLTLRTTHLAGYSAWNKL